jgi:N-acetylglucosamine-6-phosphate deacetylase
MNATTGLCDLQVNGAAGISFSDAALDAGQCRWAFRQILNRGTDRFLPTVISLPRPVYQAVLPVLAAVTSEPEFRDRIPGIHLEGPFISNQPGAVGAHDPAAVVPPDMDLFKQLLEWADGRIRLLTLAAETEGAAALCRFACDQKVVVSLGHQLATHDDLCRLADAGARALTHLGNAMPNTVPRHENPLLNGLLHPGLTPMFVADGHHLPVHLLTGMIRLRGTAHTIVVSDASPLAGMPPGEYDMLGNRCLLDQNGRLHNPEKHCLVGSSALLADCAHLLREQAGFTQAEVEQLCGENPRDLLAGAAWS